MKKLSPKAKDVITLALKLESKELGAAEIFLLEKIHAIPSEIPRGEKGEPGADAPVLTEKELLALIEPLIPEPVKGDDGYTPVKGEDYFDGKDAPLPTDERLLKLIEPLIPAPVRGDSGPVGKDGKDGTTPSYEEIVEIITPLIPKPQEIAKQVPRVQTPAKAYRIYLKDCSAQCDGANKTFTVGGSHMGIVGVYSTQFPATFRPIIDYTENRTGFTLTSEVAAPESGQSLVAQYLK